VLPADEKERLTVLDNFDRIPVENPLALTQQLKTGERSKEIGPLEAGSAEADGFIAVIESRTFIRECIRRSMQSAFPLPVLTYSTAIEMEQQLLLTLPKLIIISWVEDNREASINALKVLSELAPRIPVIVLAYNNDAELARTAICQGAKAYIPVTMGFEITVEAVRFVLAGGSYVPMDCLLASNLPGDAPSQRPPTSGLVTARELAVIRAIQKGKSNKAIAYELNMCESTVKVHVRNIMKKLKARNRTEVAIKAQTGLSAALPAGSSTEVSGGERLERLVGLPALNADYGKTQLAQPVKQDRPPFAPSRIRCDDNLALSPIRPQSPLPSTRSRTQTWVSSNEISRPAK
jgi:DNA-binding NarL/FixJ family response regulator